MLKTAPVRGLANDLWADVVLGQKDFTQYSFFRHSATSLNLPGGVVTEERESGPDRLFILDANNNRILGLSAAGQCSNGQSCSLNVECGGGGNICTLQPSTVTPTIVIGQSDFISTACNGDATNESYPNPVLPTASSLCFTEPVALSPREAVVVARPDIDSQGNLYIPDLLNNRVLKYVRPFETDQVADEVWGQGLTDNFVSGKCNSSGIGPQSLCLDGENPSIAGIDIDSAGNLWVADIGNHRVLRFPKDSTGKINKTADLVLGQSGFSSVQPTAQYLPSSLEYLLRPVSVAVDSASNVYVADKRGSNENGYYPGRIVFYSSSSIQIALNGSGTTSATAVLVNSTNPDDAPRTVVWDEGRGGLWIQSTNKTEFYNPSISQVIKTIDGANAELRGVAVDGEGNVLIVNVWDVNSNILRSYKSTTINSSNNIPYSAQNTVFTSRAYSSPYGIGGVTGITLAGSQLIVSDLMRVLFWNDYKTVATGQPADGMWDYGYWSVNLGPVRVDGSNRLWLAASGQMSSAPGIPCITNFCLRAFALPFASTSPAIKTVSLASVQNKENQSATLWHQDFVHFWPIGSGNRMWVATPWRGVMRLVNIDGKENPARGPYVDIVLGRSSWSDAGPCLADSPYTRKQGTICEAFDVRVDFDGNVWVIDKPHSMDGEGPRLLKFDAAAIPENPSQTTYGILPTKVYGTGGSWTTGPNCITDSGCAPNPPVFNKNGQMIIGANPYDGSRFGLTYLNPLAGTVPQLSFGDFVSSINESLFDPEGNLYIGDWNWNRVLVYKKPLEQFTSLIGPEVGYFGLAKADGTSFPPSETLADGTLVFRPSNSSGYYLIVEAKPGKSGRGGGSVLAPIAGKRPDLEIVSDIALGNGSVAVCDTTSGGIPAVRPIGFYNVDVLKEFGCRFTNTTVTRNSQGQTVPIQVGSKQYSMSISSLTKFPTSGEVVLQARVRDTDGNSGPTRKLILKFGGVAQVEQRTTLASITDSLRDILDVLSKMLGGF